MIGQKRYSKQQLPGGPRWLAFTRTQAVRSSKPQFATVGAQFLGEWLEVGPSWHPKIWVVWWMGGSNISKWKSQYYWNKNVLLIWNWGDFCSRFRFQCCFFWGVEVVKGIFSHCLNSVRFSVQLSSTFKPLLDLDAECCANRWGIRIRKTGGHTKPYKTHLSNGCHYNPNPSIMVMQGIVVHKPLRKGPFLGEGVALGRGYP